MIDKNIITSFCPEKAPYVALNLLGMLMGEEKARVVAKAMGFSFYLKGKASFNPVHCL